MFSIAHLNFYEKGDLLMGKKGCISLVVLLGLFILLSTPGYAATGSEQDIMTRVDELQKQVDQQQKTIDELSAQKSTLTLSKQIDNLKINGDLRVRYERRDRDKAAGGDDVLERMRARFRAGLLWKNSAENWEIGAGLTTGGEKGTGAFDTWGENEFFETGDIRLDYAYAQHTYGALKLTAGQQKNPFKTSWLLWDSDLRPTGFTAQYGAKSFFVTLGAYDVKQYTLSNSNTDFGMLYAVQLGANLKADDAKIMLAGSLYSLDGVFERNERPNPDYTYMIGDIYGSAGIPVGDVKLTLYAQTFYNFGAEGEEGEGVLGGTLDPEEENMGWVIGASAKIASISAAYSYAQVGADSCVGGLKDATFGSGVSLTDIKGHKISLYYNITKNFSVGGNVLLYEALERSNQNEVTLYQADLAYKF